THIYAKVTIMHPMIGEAASDLGNDKKHHAIIMRASGLGQRMKGTTLGYKRSKNLIKTK
ncbi:hypothetical protein ACJX0J_028399, partial [Zea mays]